MTYRLVAQWIGLLCLLTSIGCAAAVPYRYGRFRTEGLPDELAEQTGPSVEFGKPNKTLDRIANVVGLPDQIVGINKKINNHAVSLDTVAKLRSYLDRNDLADVSIYVNCYDPKDQWRRLKENRRIAAGWRYTLGTLSLLEYTLLPGRVFGGDNYNPYTNSLSISSDVPAIALYEAAFAKKVHYQKLPGTYAALTGLPGVSLVRLSQQLGDVLGYAQAQHDWDTERQTYYVLYPLFGAESASIAGVVMPAWWAIPALGAGGAVVGHATGRMIAAHRATQVDASAPDASDRLAIDPARTTADAPRIDLGEASPGGAETNHLAGS
jgi:hypothetical protein